MKIEPITIGGLTNLSDKELANKAAELLQFVEKANPINSASIVLRVQMFMQELAARKQERLVEEQRQQARLMVHCTVVMTILTVAITIMTAVLLWKTFWPN